ncbi:MAG: PhoPQ-activated pathogenicity-related family protein [Phycisphaerae bacterium]|nr:PhoPQ-activated pathogenicity-related family protein [Phycisphaerae bacterium]
MLGFAILSLIGGSLLSTPLAHATPLDDYVAAPDPNYGYSLANTFTGSGYRAYILDMTSQTWRDPNEVDRPLWRHWVKIVKPTTVSSSTALLWISGGSNGGSVPTSVNSDLVNIAKTTHTVAFELRMVPNQPLRFADETDPRYVTSGRYEDELIAYAWDKYLRSGDPLWLPRLPMTKAAVRAMDAVQTFLADPNYGPMTISNFVVTGASKRGWTTWTTGAVDPRVVAIIPIVIDILNVEISMIHHYAAYGYWAPAIQDYVDMGIMGWMGTPEIAAMFDVVDPYAYRDRYTMPKFIINASGDDFFLPDSSQFYFDDLPGEKHLRYVPNADHSLNGTYLPDALLAYYQAIVNGTPRPQFGWTFQSDGSIRVQTVTTPTQVTLWQATNPYARDFRKNPYLPGGSPAPYPGPVWTSSALSDQGGGVYVGAVSTPAQGWTGFFVELQFAGGGATPFTFTTPVRVVPDPATLTIDVGNPGFGRVVELDPNFPRYFEPNATTTLTAEPADGRSLKHWEIFDPNCPGDSNYSIKDANLAITLTMDTDRHVIAAFKCGSGVAPILLMGMAALAGWGLLLRRHRRA